MLSLQLRSNSRIRRLLSAQGIPLTVNATSLEEKVKLLILRDLLRLGWQMDLQSNKVDLTPPASYDKAIIRASMEIKRQEQIQKNISWITSHISVAKQNLANGSDVIQSKIEPFIEVCKTKEQLDLFRILRFYWSSPYSEYVGRRIKLLVRDSSLPNHPVIGIAALGSSIVHIPERDEWVGWTIKARTRNLVYTMDAYVLGALPPYNHLLGGKLISYMLASNEVRALFGRKYEGKVTNISKRKANRLACIFTTSLYGRSSQYNRLKFNDRLLYIPIGKTKGYGTLHITDETFDAMRDLLSAHKILVTNRFGDGPIWRIRVIRTASELLGFDPDFLLRHSFQRNIYAVPLAYNAAEFLSGRQAKLRYFDLPINSLIAHWRNRWFDSRKKNEEVINEVKNFSVKDFWIR